MQRLKLHFLAAALDHDDGMPLTVLFSVLALSLIVSTPESMGEDTVQSTREEGVASVEPESVMEVKSKTGEAAKSGTVRVVDSGVEVCAMSVTGRMVGAGAEVLTVCMSEGVGESAEGKWPESMGGGGEGEGETVTGLGGVEE